MGNKDKGLKSDQTKEIYKKKGTGNESNKTK